MADNPDASTVGGWLIALQGELLAACEALDGSAFRRDPWQDARGNGLTAVIENGALFERGGINFSHVHGRSLPPTATAKRPELAGRAYEAMGVSLVLHPKNPYCPTGHLNVRFFLAAAQDEAPAVWWFGGGMDITPYYPEVADVRHFHATAKAALDARDPALHPRFKAACDDYFYLKHRNEPRGAGGVFFDDFNERGFDNAFAVAQAVGGAFVPAYLPILERQRHRAYGKRQRDFQNYRRGRYVEFNLVWDRGTLFGLHGGGRTEAILMSLPPVVNWRYDWQPEPGSPEESLYADFLVPRDWV